MLVRRKLGEDIILEALQEKLAGAKQIHYVLKQVEKEVKAQFGEVLETIKLKEAELSAEERRVGNFIEFIAEGRGSTALAKVLAEAERKVEALQTDLAALR